MLEAQIEPGDAFGDREGGPPDGWRHDEQDHEDGCREPMVEFGIPMGTDGRIRSLRIRELQAGQKTPVERGFLEWS